MTETRRAVRRHPARRAARSATPRPTRRSTSAAATPRTSSRSSSTCASARTVDVDAIPTDGIDVVEPIDLEYAEKFGYVIKPLVIARDHGDGDRGARPPGADPGELAARRRRRRQERGLRPELRARAVDVLRRRRRHAADRDGGRLRHDRDRPQHLRARRRRRRARRARARRRRAPLVPLADIRTRYYLRFGVADQPGVLGQLMTILGAHGVSIAQVVQDSRAGDAEPVVGRRAHPRGARGRRARRARRDRRPRRRARAARA